MLWTRDETPSTIFHQILNRHKRNSRVVLDFFIYDPKHWRYFILSYHVRSAEWIHLCGSNFNHIDGSYHQKEQDQSTNPNAVT